MISQLEPITGNEPKEEAIINPKAKLSANSLFHYLNKYEYLEDIILTKSFIPRFSTEDFSQMQLELELDSNLKYVAIAMKCFCDIPLHNVKNHKKEYGGLCIGLRKEWGIQHGLQPVIYLNPESRLKTVIKETYSNLIRYFKEEKENDDSGELLNEFLKYVKCLRGVDLKNGENKDFTDEKEWRYVPFLDESFDFGEVISNLDIIDTTSLEMFNRILQKKADKVSLVFEYSDVRFIFLKTEKQRLKLINRITNLSDIDNDDKCILISRIHLWDEVEGDF